MYCPPTSSCMVRPICLRRMARSTAALLILAVVSHSTTSAPAGNLDVISSSASDTATKITFYGRDATGVIQNQTLSLNGQTWVTGSQSLERLLYAALSGATANGPTANPGGAAAVGDVALAAHSCVLPTGSVTTDATVRTAQSGSANHTGTTPALFKLQAGDGASVSLGQVIWIRSGTGANQLRQIIVTSGYGSAP